MRLSKVLVANRGEIAVRVLRTARRLGYRTVAVYSSADARAPHVAAADEAVCLGPAAASESYLAVERVIAAARTTGADAVHPGYGFLSENADFARACADANIVFVGPPIDAIELMGNKRAAKVRMTEAGVRCVPGYQGPDQADATLLGEAGRIGFPVMVKAAAGGGGRGMRLVHESESLKDALRAARAEAESAFGSAELILEKALLHPRHVEIQIFGDQEGNVVHLGERDCSVQRRHQKVLEESPSPAVDSDLRNQMGRAAIDAARASGYVGAGTVEFLLDEDRRFYFLEMNTRLQVEHPVTELVTGVDLVEWQLRVAEKERLPLLQEQISLRGHAIEARLYAEDPARGFMPQTGEILRWKLPEGMDVRVDHGIREGGTVPAHYDPMIAKLIAHGRTRDEARRKLLAALGETTLLGVVTNKAFLMSALQTRAFAEGDATTAFVSEHLEGDSCLRLEPPDDVGLALAGLVVILGGARGLVEDESFIGWRSGGPVWTTVKLECNEAITQLDITAKGRGTHGWRFDVNRAGDGEQRRVELELVEHDGAELVVVVGGVRRAIRFAVEESVIWVDEGLVTRRYDNVTHRPARAAAGAGTGRLIAPLDGSVSRIFVETNENVAAGKLLLVLEAMKMEHQIKADIDGSVKALHVTVGDQVRTRQLLAEIAPREQE